MKNLVLLLVVLLWGVMASAQNEQAFYLDFPVSYAGEYNVILTTWQADTTLLSIEEADTIYKGFYGNVGNISVVNYEIQTKHYLKFPDSTLLEQRNASIVCDSLNRIYLLSAYHCFDRFQINSKILDMNGKGYISKENDIVMLPLSDRYKGLSPLELASIEAVKTGDVCVFGYIRSFDRQSWEYRIVTGEVEIFNEKEITKLFRSPKQMRKFLREQKRTYRKDPANGEITQKLGVSTRKASKINAEMLKRDFLSQRDYFIANADNLIFMEVGKRLYDEIPGASGSSLVNFDKRAIAVVHKKLTGRGEKEGKYYTVFQSINVIKLK